MCYIQNNKNKLISDNIRIRCISIYFPGQNSWGDEKLVTGVESQNFKLILRLVELLNFSVFWLMKFCEFN